MYPYQNDIAEATKAMEVARIALVNLHTKFEANGLPFTIASALELELKNLLSTVTVISDMASHERVRHATFILQGEGYEVKAPQMKETNEVGMAIALVVRNGYKVTDSQGRNY